MKRFKFTIRGNEYETEIIKLKGLNARIEVNGTQYEVELQRPKSRPGLSIKRPSISGQNFKGNENKGNIYAVKAPLPGIVMRVFVKEGDKIEKDGKLLVYEAMKMENLIKSDKEGIIKSVKVKETDSILQDDLLIEIEL